jgi:hypothetical protein
MYRNIFQQCGVYPNASNGESLWMNMDGQPNVVTVALPFGNQSHGVPENRQ